MEELNEGEKIVFEKMRKALVYTNVAYLLADVINGIVVDLDQELRSMSVKVNYGELKQFKKILVAADSLKTISKKIAKPIYNLEDSDSAITDSDWMSEVIMLIIDRIGNDEVKADEIKGFIQGMPSQLNIYKTNDEIKSAI